MKVIYASLQVLVFLVCESPGVLFAQDQEVLKDGFTFRIPADWEVSDKPGYDLGLRAIAKVAKGQFLENMLISKYVLPQVMSAEEVLALEKENFEGLKVNAEGTLVDSTRKFSWIAVTAEPEPGFKMTMTKYILVQDKTAIVINAYAETSSWQQHQKLFETFVKSIRFKGSSEDSSASNYSSWSKYVQKEYGFQLQFPQKPIVENPSEKNRQKHIAIVRPSAINKLTYVCESHLAGDIYDRLAEDGLADQMEYLYGYANGKKMQFEGELVGKGRESKIGKFRAWEYTIADNKSLVRCRTYMTGNRVVNLMVIGEKEAAGRSEIAQQFFDSFKETIND